MTESPKIATMVPSRIEMQILDVAKVIITSATVDGVVSTVVTGGIPAEPNYQDTKLRKIAKFAVPNPTDADKAVRDEFRKAARQDGKLCAALQDYKTHIDNMFPNDDLTSLTPQDIAFAEGFVSVGGFQKKPADWTDLELVDLLKKVVPGDSGPTG